MAPPSQAIAPTDAELLQAQADLWRHSLFYLTSTALKCAVELHIPTAIHDLGGSTTLPDLLSALSLPKNKLPFLGRLMRLLVTSGIFASDGGSNGDAEEAVYRLNPLSWLLVEGVESEDHTYQKYFVLATVSQHYIEAGLSLADWFKKDLPEPLASPFETLHGVPLVHESTKLLDEELDRIVEEGVAAHDNLAIGTIIRECGDVFSGLHSLTYCCGRQGNTGAKAIIKAFPDIKCTVLNVPRVIDKTAPVTPAFDGVSTVTGDLFHTIPPAQAVMLKLVLHFWGDEDCVKILEQCRKAIPSKEEGGKVIIIEILLGPYMGPIMYEAQLLMDMLFLVNTKGKQRTENEWRQIFTKAGFSDYKIVKKLGARGVIEVYP